MRTIKFRAWDKENKAMVELRTVESWSDGSYICRPKDAKLQPIVAYTEPSEYTSIIMQFTGLLDKNGKEIYEGDIVKTWLNRVSENKYIHQVVFAKNGFKLQYPHIEDIYEELDCRDNIEVIGNLYENPELLKKNL